MSDMAGQLRVLYVAPREYSSDRRNYNQLQRVLYAPTAVSVEVLVAKGARVTVDLPGNVEVRRASIPGRLGFLVEELRLLVRRRRFDAVVTTDTFEAIPAWLFRAWGRYRWVADIWDTPQKALVSYHALTRGLGARLRRFAAQVKVGLFRHALRRADLVIVSACADGLGDYRIPTAKTRVFTNAIDLDILDNALVEPRDAQSICYVSSLFLPDRGVVTLADAVATLESWGRTPRVVLVGVLPEDLERRLRLHPAAGHFEILGRIPLEAAHQVMRRSEVGVLPFHANPDLAHTQPVKLLEYMAFGCVVVASDLPGFRHIVRPDRDAVLAEPGDAESLATALDRVLGDSALREELRESGRRRVRLFDARAKVESVYEEIEKVCA